MIAVTREGDLPLPGRRSATLFQPRCDQRSLGPGYDGFARAAGMGGRREDRIHPSGLEVQILQAISTGDTGLVKEWASRTVNHEEARERISRVFLNTVNNAAPSTQQVLYETGLINFNFADSINERNCIHEAAVSGKKDVLNAALASGANIRAPDVYGRIPLHYASMHGHAEIMQILVSDTRHRTLESCHRAGDAQIWRGCQSFWNQRPHSPQPGVSVRIRRYRRANSPVQARDAARC
jgi:hypothetical protein